MQHYQTMLQRCTTMLQQYVTMVQPCTTMLQQSFHSMQRCYIIMLRHVLQHIITMLHRYVHMHTQVE